MLLLVFCAFLSSVYYYVEAFRWGMNARMWALAGLLMGPFLLPLFSIQRHVQWRRAAGFNNLVIQA
ncbi:hypothetical protein [Alteromonas sp. CYL-A6]|uniref:hypothetical protein n=1 Tax=Alteromonas nitratireducens TaxID=3390813 RepID=UPI0034C117CA